MQVRADIVEDKDTKKENHIRKCSGVVQLAERLTVNQNVRGSSPRAGAKIGDRRLG